MEEHIDAQRRSPTRPERVLLLLARMEAGCASRRLALGLLDHRGPSMYWLYEDSITSHGSSSHAFKAALLGATVPAPLR